MRKIKRMLFGRRQPDPPNAPCGHVPPLFRALNGKLVTITTRPQFDDESFVIVPPNIWCTHCGWVKISHDQYNQYWRLNIGDQAA